MKFEQQFSQKQSQTQKLAMTQKLQQSIQILQYNTEDLIDYIDNKALENPLLEVIEPSYSSNYSKPRKSSGEEMNYLSQIPDNSISLFEHLIDQVHLNYRDTYLRQLVLYLVEYIDLNGFLKISLKEAAEKTGGSAIQLLDALTLIQQLDPAGVGARNLQECLMLQTERDNSAPHLAYVVLEEMFKELVDRKWEKIAKNFDISLSDVQEIFDYIQNLTPTPGAIYGATEGLFIIPDLTVKIDDQELKVLSNRKSIPEIKFQQNYFERMEKSQDPEVLKYLKDKQQDYEWLKKTVQQRGDTIYRVGKAIVSHQKDFFLDKDRPLKPLTLKDISEELEIHESTVSRAVNGKYLETVFGVFELKSFFSKKIGENSNESSANDAKHLLQQLVEQEDKAKPLSDQKLTELMKDKGIAISRRTVAKYRDALNIAGSSKRKRYD
ncbi:RNA polymerase factor sigma-54 [Tetragenococcus halophilus]|uniref:RNA polymerase sigma factor RpoN n=1 Tax=Tetragenococcus halophilus subsp. halophilus TaxID=1513897 RepID=A0A2H6CUM6_TETHA|nr:RNA polymerase factor sigma-54 [Tetragenococcus halophilus]MCO8283709.1 RNA polymerase factor sigma-54 [Tetragenococcus halophilus]MCT8311367.1 RNA polymerase factor sigma-54 [Tetragenococcus halophilus]GBD66590.1 RNA polymerase sigma factor RpoN [Tetragenococcus halophilus subsp. halophilus]GBD68695.1 RNA polymerase sigma factor RpoN [Tetragenococcus halophilus subsp. halophilus]GBD78487.1 RNA polymerase sigma factor RpoN [Tetragenococcus halophilus subsp. halophilus]